MGVLCLGYCIAGIVWLSFMGWAVRRAPGVALTKTGQWPDKIINDEDYQNDLSYAFFIAAAAYVVFTMISLIRLLCCSKKKTAN